MLLKCSWPECDTTFCNLQAAPECNTWSSADMKDKHEELWTSKIREKREQELHFNIQECRGRRSWVPTSKVNRIVTRGSVVWTSVIGLYSLFLFNNCCVPRPWTSVSVSAFRFVKPSNKYPHWPHQQTYTCIFQKPGLDLKAVRLIVTGLKRF